MRGFIALLLTVAVVCTAAVFGFGALSSAVTPAVPANAPTHVGQPTEWSNTPVKLATNYCGGFGAPVCPLSGVIAVSFSPSQEMWVRIASAFYGPGAAMYAPACQTPLGMSVVCGEWMVWDNAYFCNLFATYPGGLVLFWSMPSGVFDGAW